MEVEKGFWRNLIIIGVIGLIILFYWASSSNTSNTQNNPVNTDFYSSSWNEYSTTLNNDIAKINEIKSRYPNMDTTAEIDNYIAKIDPRYQIYSTHLIEARNFLNTYGDQLSNGAELKRSIDENIVQLNTEINQFNLAVKRYNEQIQVQQDQQEAILDFVKLLSVVI